MANGFLEIRYMAENGRVFRGVETLDPDEPRDSDPTARTAMISDVCHGFAEALAEPRNRRRELFAAEAVRWRWKCSDASARRWIRAKLMDRDTGYRSVMAGIGVDLDDIDPD
ncbi:hypothetical protein ACFY00_19840 [Kitasatospora sp. NPDC001540]|uniref:hypothetical protein n=1 Tax=Kitasatospora sp. NPDC001540 TaxID=3364014 RepID=UPI0036BB8C63